MQDFCDFLPNLKVYVKLVNVGNNKSYVASSAVCVIKGGSVMTRLFNPTAPLMVTASVNEGGKTATLVIPEALDVAINLNKSLKINANSAAHH